MFRLSFFLLIIVVLNWHPGKAQSPMALFQDASTYALKGNWEDCRQMLRPHLFPPPEDTLAPHMLHLYALACEKIGDRASAIATEEQLLQRFPNWSGVAESNFFLGEMALKQNRFRKAFGFFTRISLTYLPDFKSLVSKISIPPDTIQALKETSEWASNPYVLVLSEVKIASPRLVNGAMKIGVVLPFQVDELASRQSKSPPAEYYRGMLLAAEVLRAIDSTVELYPFDTRNDSKYLTKLLRDNALNGLDAVVGPLRASDLPALADWCKATRIPCINPLSQHCPEKGSDYFFMQQPDFATVARSCFEFVAPMSFGQKVGIVFGPEKNDSLQAEAYRTHVKKMGREVVLFRKVGKNSAANLTKFLFEAGLDSTCHLFVPNSEPLVRNQLLGAYGWIKAKYPIVITGKWLESNNADFEEWSRNPVWFATGDLPDLTNPNRKNWADSYKAKWGSPANWIAWKGFDLVFTLARSWYSFGQKWPDVWRSGQIQKSELFGQYQFNSLQPSNQYIPVYHVEGREIRQDWPR